MSKDKIRYEINKVLDHFSERALSDLLSFLENIERTQSDTLFNSDALDEILREDKVLLEKLER